MKCVNSATTFHFQCWQPTFPCMVLGGDVFQSPFLSGQLFHQHSHLLRSEHKIQRRSLQNVDTFQHQVLELPRKKSTLDNSLSVISPSDFLCRTWNFPKVLYTYIKIHIIQNVSKLHNMYSIKAWANNNTNRVDVCYIVYYHRAIKKSTQLVMYWKYYEWHQREAHQNCWADGFLGIKTHCYIMYHKKSFTYHKECG